MLAEDSRQQGDPIREDRTHTYLPIMAMQTDIRQWYGARPAFRQTVTASGPLPQRGLPAATGGTTWCNGGRQRQQCSNKKPKNLSDTPEVPLVFAQWNAEGLRHKKPELQEFLRREHVDIICIQETHLADAHRFFVREGLFVRSWDGFLN